MSKTYLFLAEGFEDIEALAVVDVLRRGGVEVRTVSVMEGLEVRSAHGVTVWADVMLGEVKGRRRSVWYSRAGCRGRRIWQHAHH